MPNGNPDFVRHAAEAGMEVHSFVVNKQVFGGGGADAEHDLVVLHILGGHAGVFVYPYGDVWRVAVV